jgi:hypothetical protein
MTAEAVPWRNGGPAAPTSLSNADTTGAGRGERDSPATTDLPITMRLAEPPEPHELFRTA